MNITVSMEKQSFIKGPTLVMYTNTSELDWLIVMSSLPVSCCFIVKSTLFRIPAFWVWMKFFRNIPISPFKEEEAKMIIGNTITQCAKENISIAIAGDKIIKKEQSQQASETHPEFTLEFK